ncbi:MFS transporter [Natronospira bacteriovora]|uniref:MFS transporter n=1 Tax=Natronospira bacteriovora TaxID=3069753 RepID=A0ABU0W3Z9_9GAMM|nr:MFS transporter [Natronospira sp. AB-CW4]MDQ2068691.1 MFS transporter [Natronospira sp. AB-CW4]
MAAALSSFGQTFYIGLFSGEIRDDFDLSHGQFGLYYSLATLASGFAILWVGRLVDRLDLRVISALTVSTFGIASIIMALVVHPLSLLATLFLLRLLGQGMMGHIAITAMSRYFTQARGRAIAIAASGFPLGEAVLPLVAISLTVTIGWRNTWLTSGLALLFIGLPLLLALLQHQPRRDRLWRLKQHRQQRPGHRASQRQWAVSDVLTDARFWLLMPIILSPAFYVTGFFFHQVHLAEAKTWPLQWLAACFAVFAATQFTGLMTAGYLTDRITARRLLPFYLLPLAGGMIVIWLGNSIWWMPLYMALFGLTAGTSATIVAAIWAEMYGTRHLGSIRSIYTSLMVFSTAASPWLMGSMLDGGLHMEELAMLSFFWLLGVSSLSFLLGPALSKRQRHA